MRAHLAGELPRERLVIVVVRGVLFVGCSILTLAVQTGVEEAFALGLVFVAAVTASIPFHSPTLTRLGPAVEILLACVAVLLVEPLPETLLPYLLAPALAAGLSGGFAAAGMASGLAALVLLVGRYAGDEELSTADYLSTVGRWTLIMLCVGMLGGWVQRVQGEPQPPENAAYASAYRLLSQLRLVSRQLSAGLDPVTLAEGLLEHLHESVPAERAAVYVRSMGGRLTPVAFRGEDRIDWKSDGPLFDEAWASAVPVRHDKALTAGRQGFSAAVPLRIGLRTFGLVAMERSEAFEALELKGADEVVEEQALRLETALLFSEVRTLATAEERRRLAREIHDGIAQELASLGYVVDDLAARARYLPELEVDIRGLRRELTRIITELRLSIFDLRSEANSTTGLGTALSDYVRQIGAGSNLTVHLVLDESTIRLPVDVEAELMRIAQEAITNARKHAQAENLWVTCMVDPPRAVLSVEDDGQGMGRPRDDSFGLEVMRERAQRIGGRLKVTARPEGGTSVEVSLGPTSRAG